MNKKIIASSLVIVIYAAVTNLQAASATWDGDTSASWNNDANWSAANPNGTTQTATFNSAAYSFQPNLNVNRSIASLNFGASNGGISLTGNVGLSLTLNGLVGINALAGSGANTISVATINVGVGQTWRNASDNLLSVSSAVGLGSNLLVLDGQTGKRINLSGDITGAGGLTTVNNGTVTLSGTNSYTGNTRVGATGSIGGTLLVNGSLTGSDVTVAVGNPGATLGGNGTITPGAGKTLTVNSGGILAPGAVAATPDSLTVNLSNVGDSAVFATGSTFSIDLAAPGSSDLVEFTGLTLNVADVAFNSNVINFTNAGGLDAGLYTLFSFDAANAYSGTLAIGTGLESYVGSSFVYNGNSIQLNVVPEPSTGVLLLLGGALLYHVRKQHARSTAKA
jgi:hypothetical protein